MPKGWLRNRGTWQGIGGKTEALVVYVCVYLCYVQWMPKDRSSAHKGLLASWAPPHYWMYFLYQWAFPPPPHGGFHNRDALGPYLLPAERDKLVVGRMPDAQTLAMSNSGPLLPYVSHLPQQRTGFRSGTIREFPRNEVLPMMRTSLLGIDHASTSMTAGAFYRSANFFDVHTVSRVRFVLSAKTANLPDPRHVPFDFSTWLSKLLGPSSHVVAPLSCPLFAG
jgi:hypothetical protein